jgi:hypothetical protein
MGCYVIVRRNVRLASMVIITCRTIVVRHDIRLASMVIICIDGALGRGDCSRWFWRILGGFLVCRLGSCTACESDCKE